MSLAQRQQRQQRHHNRYMQLAIWLVLLLIGVFDAREYRIPNYLVLLLFGVSCAALSITVLNSGELALIVPHIYGFLMAFIVGVLFYALKIMAAGDVKLIAVVGFILGHSALLVLTQYIAFACGFIGIMYWLLNQIQISQQRTVVNRTQNKFNLSHYISVQLYQAKNNFKARRNISYMPFAPVLIVALAMYHYFKI